jgi:hypothetical protein
MKRHGYHRYPTGEFATNIIAVNGGPSNENGWLIAFRHDCEERHGVFRRYYPPGYARNGTKSLVLIRYLKDRTQWWVAAASDDEWPRVGPYPSRLVAHAMLVLLR